MKDLFVRIALIFCCLIMLLNIPFWNSNSVLAEKTAWEDYLTFLLTENDSRPASELYDDFKGKYPYAADWISQDSSKEGMEPHAIFTRNADYIYKLAKNVDSSCSPDDTTERLIKKYAAAVEKRSKERLTNLLNTVSNQFIVVKHKQLGGTHYAYTEAVSDDRWGSPEGNEYNYYSGSEMVLLTLKVEDDRIVKHEEMLLSTTNGVIRDPDVSEDGTKVLFSYKKENSDDFHLYEMEIATKKMRQLTFDPGVADTEPKYLNNGKIVFNSTRAIQNVDCWRTPVSNLYICDGDGRNIRRIGFDQVHTTYPTVTSDGRVIYTRWDYNDRTQMYIQSVFQMFTDGTNQTELFGNNANFPTTLAHTREIPGEPGKYVTIIFGHHTLQAGKLAIIDISKGRNSPDAVEFVFPDKYTVKDSNIDNYGQQGALYKYPYPINSLEFLVSHAPDGYAEDKRSTPFAIYYINAKGERELLSPASDGVIGASQAVPVKKRALFERPDLVDYGQSTGYFYIGDIYEGEGLKGIKRGSAKHLRIVALNFRTAAIGANKAAGVGTSDPFTPVSAGNGAWDVKEVLGIVPIEEDGSVLFEAPARVPLYFQVLDEKGELIQSMRSWTTLMPGETFSCVGCHEDKNTVPPMDSTFTMAMKKGPKKIQPDFWQKGERYADYDPYGERIGFSYMKEVQPILDNSCVSCHNTSDESPISLESYLYFASREKRNYPHSYIVLTGSKWNGEGEQFMANNKNKYTNWISGMSGAEILKPYEFGSSKSGIIQRLRSGHGNLKDEEIRRIAAWIDLGVPLCGSYDEQSAWGPNDLREFEEKNNKRAYYDKLDELAIKVLLNNRKYPVDGELSIRHIRGDKEIGSATGTGLVQLFGSRRFAIGDKIRVELPKGEKYLFFNLDTRLKEALLYAPDGVFEYTFHSDVSKTMPATVKPNTRITHKFPVITARLPLDEELKETRNLALNPYYVTENGASNAYPHGTASNSFGNGNNPEFDARNAIDGFRNNLGHGSYPVQSWGPDNNVSDLWYKVDFGRSVELSSVAVTIRADFPHDTHLKGAILEFSDGTEKAISLKKTTDPQTIELDNVKTTYIKLKNFDKAENKWFAITEIEAFGVEDPDYESPPDSTEPGETEPVPSDTDKPDGSMPDDTEPEDSKPAETELPDDKPDKKGAVDESPEEPRDSPGTGDINIGTWLVCALVVLALILIISHRRILRF